MFRWINRGLENNNDNFTVCYFTDVSFRFVAVIVFNFQLVVVTLNHEARNIIIWFSVLVRTIRGIAAIQPVVRSGRSRRSFLQSDEILFIFVRPVPDDTLIAIISDSTTSQTLGCLSPTSHLPFSVSLHLVVAVLRGSVGTSNRAPLNWTPCYGAWEVSVLLLLLLLLSSYTVRVKAPNIWE